MCVGFSGIVVLLGTPETRRRGRSTRKARRALTSNPPGLPPDWPPESASLVIISRTTLNNLATVDGEQGEATSGAPERHSRKRSKEQSPLWDCGRAVPLCTLTCKLCMGFFYVRPCERVSVCVYFLPLSHLVNLQEHQTKALPSTRVHGYVCARACQTTAVSVSSGCDDSELKRRG